MGGALAQYECVKAFSETDFTEDLQMIEAPILILHGEDDQIVPIAASARVTAKIVKNCVLKTYPGLGWPPHTPTASTKTSCRSSDADAGSERTRFDAQLDDQSLTPGPGAHLGKLKLGEWLERR